MMVVLIEAHNDTTTYYIRPKEIRWFDEDGCIGGIPGIDGKLYTDLPMDSIMKEIVRDERNTYQA